MPPKKKSPARSKTKKAKKEIKKTVTAGKEQPAASQKRKPKTRTLKSSKSSRGHQAKDKLWNAGVRCPFCSDVDDRTYVHGAHIFPYKFIPENRDKASDSDSSEFEFTKMHEEFFPGISRSDLIDMCNGVQNMVLLLQQIHAHFDGGDFYFKKVKPSDSSDRRYKVVFTGEADAGSKRVLEALGASNKKEVTLHNDLDPRFMAWRAAATKEKVKFAAGADVSDSDSDTPPSSVDSEVVTKNTTAWVLEQQQQQQNVRSPRARLVRAI